HRQRQYPEHQYGPSPSPPHRRWTDTSRWSSGGPAEECGTAALYRFRRRRLRGTSKTPAISLIGTVSALLGFRQILPFLQLQIEVCIDGREISATAVPSSQNP